MNTNSQSRAVQTPNCHAHQGRLWSCLIIILLLLMSVPSCRSDITQVQPPLAVPEAFSLPGRQEMSPEWWTAFEDSSLNSLIEQALQGNFSLRIAWDRLAQARALASQSTAPLWPSIDGSAGISRTATKSSGSGWNSNSNFSLGVVAGYELDLWGRLRSTRDAASLDVAASDEELHVAAMTVTAQVARTFYLLVEQQGQLQLLNEQIEINKKYLEIITLKFRRGQVSATDVLQQRQLVESNRGEKILVESNIQLAQHTLAVLLGRAPGTLAVPSVEGLAELPARPLTGLPAQWIRRRPDVRAAQLRVQAADKRVAAAIADQFPKLSLSLGAETSAEHIRDVFDNWLANLAANLVAPLFDAGRRRTEVERTRAVVSEQLNSYGQVVLDSLQEVEDALVREDKQQAYLASLRAQLDLSRKSMEQTRENYSKGTMEFTRYLTALLAHQSLQRTYLQAQRQLLEFRIDLYRALGGSWKLTPPAPASTKAVLDSPAGNS